jgi:hypothetical protein
VKWPALIAAFALGGVLGVSSTLVVMSPQSSATVAAPEWAATVRCVPPQTALNGVCVTGIPVWIGEAASRDGSDLLARGHVDLAMPYLSCVIAPGTRVLRLDGGDAVFLVAVTDGPNQGCRGAIVTRAEYSRLAHER